MVRRSVVADVNHPVRRLMESLSASYLAAKQLENGGIGSACLNTATAY
jgi:hypothetical protein